MAHYAKVINGLVEQVIVAESEFFDTFVDTSPGEWIQTSLWEPPVAYPDADSDETYSWNEETTSWDLR